jgi:hypothetical protein
VLLVLYRRVGSSLRVGGVRGGHFLRGGSFHRGGFATVEAVLLCDCWWDWGTTGGTVEGAGTLGIGSAGTSGGGGLEAGVARANCGISGAGTVV